MSSFLFLNIKKKLRSYSQKKSCPHLLTAWRHSVTLHLILTDWPLLSPESRWPRLRHRTTPAPAGDRLQPQQQTRVCQTLRQTYINLLLFIQQATGGQQKLYYYSMTCTLSVNVPPKWYLLFYFVLCQHYSRSFTINYTKQ